jgi:hypothetical protein
VPSAVGNARVAAVARIDSRPERNRYHKAPPKPREAIDAPINAQISTNLIEGRLALDAGGVLESGVEAVSITGIEVAMMLKTVQVDHHIAPLEH